MSRFKRPLSIQLSKLLCASLIISKGFLSSSAFAMPVNPNPIIVNQSNGSEISLRLKGDRNFNWLEDINGYTVIYINGTYYYANLNDRGDLSATSALVGIVKPADIGLTKGILPSAKKRLESAPILLKASTSIQKIVATGTIKNLVVMVRFKDHADANRILPSQADMEILFNNTGPHATLAPTGSVKDVYLENSYGQMILNSTTTGWIDVSGTEAYYANGNSGDHTLWEALKEALDIADDTIDFNDYDSDGDGYIDSITFIHSGYGAEWGGVDSAGQNYKDRIWSHRWVIGGEWTSNESVKVFDYHISPGLWSTSGSNIGRIGVIAHETGHFFGLPDLYDTSKPGEGIGSYGLMANSWGFDGSQYYPPHFSAWSKIQLGWVTPTVISADGTYTLTEVESNPNIIRINQGFPAGEYLLIENRQPIGFDGDMPQGGLAIWHIDEDASHNGEGYPGQTGWPANGEHYQVALLQADGLYNLEKGENRGDGGDVYHSGGVDQIVPYSVSSAYPNTDAYQGGNIIDTGNEIHSISAAGSTMTFCLGDCSPTVIVLAPSDLVAVATSTSAIDLSWVDNSSNENGFRVERSLNGSTGWAALPMLAAGTQSTTDSGLNAGTQYYYRVSATHSTNDSDYSNIANATTQIADVLLAPSNLVAIATSTSNIDLSWTDNSSNEDNFKLERSLNGIDWAEIISLGSNVTQYSNSGLNAGTRYYYRVRATNSTNDSDYSNSANTATDDDIIPITIDYFAIGESTTTGFSNTSYNRTHTDNSSFQRITEWLNFSNFSDDLEHRWTFNITEGETVSLVANTWKTNLFPFQHSISDNFTFEYSTDGVHYIEAFRVSSTSPDNVQSTSLPAGISGTVYIRVIDTDGTPRVINLQAINIDHLYIRSETAGGG